MEIKADELSINKILRDNEDIFRVPNYQRRYSWTQEQWSDLWNDLNSISESETHFLGSIVVITRQYNPTSFNELELVDGQQRLATLSIVLCVMRDYLQKIEKADMAEEIEREYLHNKKFEEKALKIKLGDLDQNDFQKLIEGNVKEVENIILKKSYDFFMDKINDMDYEDIKILRKKILDQTLVVLITTGSERSAFRLFETLNDRGLELSAIDLMKNYILKVSSGNGSVRIENIKGEWEEIIKNLEDVDRKIRFFRHYLMSAKKPETKQKITQKKVYDRFKIIIDNELKREGITIEEYVEDMREQSELYSHICHAEVDRFSHQFNKQINFHLKNFKDMGAVPARTLLLRAFREIQDAQEMVEILKLIEIFSIRRIIGRLPTGELDTLYNQLALSAFNQNNPVRHIKEIFLENITSDEEFKKNFSERDYKLNDFTKYILDTIEREHYMSMGSGKEIADRYNVHIEHIAPRGAFYAKKYSSWKSYLDVDEEEFDKIRNKIGNLTLFERKLNIKASNKPFEQKKKIYEKETDFIMTKDICDYDEWKKEQIIKRSQNLAEIASKIWRLK